MIANMNCETGLWVAILTKLLLVLHVLTEVKCTKYVEFICNVVCTRCVDYELLACIFICFSLGVFFLFLWFFCRVYVGPGTIILSLALQVPNLTNWTQFKF